MQLPAFTLSPDLSDRQQASSVNLKPSELRLSQSSEPLISQSSEPCLSTDEEPGSLQLHGPQPAPRGILKKSSSSIGSEWIQVEEAEPSSQQQNVRVCEEAGTDVGKQQQQQLQAEVLVPPPRRERRQATAEEGSSRTGAPWRQRARARRETIACCMPVRLSSEQEENEDLRVSTGEKEVQEASDVQ